MVSSMTKAAAALLVFGVTVNSLSTRVTVNQATTKYDFKVVQMELSESEVNSLRDEQGYDFWKIAHHKGHASKTFLAEVMVPHSASSVGNVSLERRNAVTVVENVAELLQQESQRIEKKSKSSVWTAKRGDDSFFETYRPYADHRRFLLELAEENPDTVELLPSIGKTWEDRDILTVHIKSPRSSPGDRPAVYLQSTVHAREWLATTSLAWTMKALAEGYGNNQTITYLLDNLDFYITPIVNIDGYIYTWEENRLWRKNRRNNGGGSYGVDINRNWGPESTWCTAGSSTNPSSDTYCGAYAFSEPETAASAKFVDNHPAIRASVDFHTYGPLLLWPWQYTYDRIPEPGYTEMDMLGESMASAINMKAQPDYRYVPEQGSDLYPHSGGMIDYCFEKHGITAMTFEGRGEGFVTPDSDIVPAGAEQFEGVAVLASYAIGKK
eukprot:m.81315 g.81315  ORF g.81315 m.81315 type:complete len:439 (+) comp25404_c0_seq3:46-1362(+)